MRFRAVFRIRRRWGLALLLAMALVGPAASGEPAEEPAARVEAKRYRIKLVESALEWSHGGGFWCEEIHLPTDGLVCNVTFETDTDAMVKGEKDWVWPKASAFASPIRNRYRPFPSDAEDRVAPVEALTIPVSLAQEIRAFADLTRRQQEESRRLGKKLVDLGICRVADPYTKKLLDLQKKAEKTPSKR